MITSISGSASTSASGAGSSSSAIGSSTSVRTPSSPCVVGDRHLHQAQLRLVAALGHELGVDGQAAVLGGAVGQRLDHGVSSRRTRETIRSRRSTPRSSGPPISMIFATWSLARASSACAPSSPVRAS